MDYIFFCFFACLIIFDWMVDIVIFTLLNKDFVVFLSSILLAHRKLLKEQCEHCEAYFFFFLPRVFLIDNFILFFVSLSLVTFFF